MLELLNALCEFRFFVFEFLVKLFDDLLSFFLHSLNQLIRFYHTLLQVLLFALNSFQLLDLLLVLLLLLNESLRH